MNFQKLFQCFILIILLNYSNGFTLENLNVFNRMIAPYVNFVSPQSCLNVLECVHGKCLSIGECQCENGYEGFLCDIQSLTTTFSTVTLDNEISDLPTTAISTSTISSTTVTGVNQTTSVSPSSVATASTTEAYPTIISTSFGLNLTTIITPITHISQTTTELPSTTIKANDQDSVTITESSFAFNETEFATTIPTSIILEENSTLAQTITVYDVPSNPLTNTFSSSPTISAAITNASIIDDLSSSPPPTSTTTIASTCPFADYCIQVGGNAICDMRCNIEECNFDQGDCEDDDKSESKREILCPKECLLLQNNGICNENCNIEACEFDGNDCLNLVDATSQKEELKKILSIVIIEENSKENDDEVILENVKSFLNTSADFTRDAEGKIEIYEYSKEIGGELKNVKEYHFNVDFNQCTLHQTNCRFESVNEVADFLNTAPIYEVTSALGVPIYEARVMERPTKDGFNTNWFLCIIIGIFGFSFIIFGGLQVRATKRRLSNIYVEPDDNLGNNGGLPKKTRLEPEFYWPQDGASFYKFMRSKNVNENVLIEAIQKLHSTDLNWKTENSETLLHWAIRLNYFKVANFLLHKVENINASDAFGNTPLTDSIKNKTEAVEFFSKLMSMPNIEVNTTLNFNMTPLKLCAESDDFLPFAKILCYLKNIKLKAIGFIKGRKCLRQTVLHHAASCGSVEIIKLLNDKERSLISERDGNGRTPLICALEAEQWEAAKILIKLMPSVDFNFEIKGISPLIAAKKTGNAEIIELVKARLPKEKAPTPKKKKATTIQTTLGSSTSCMNLFYSSFTPPPITIANSAIGYGNQSGNQLNNCGTYFSPPHVYQHQPQHTPLQPQSQYQPNITYPSPISQYIQCQPQLQSQLNMDNTIATPPEYSQKTPHTPLRINHTPLRFNPYGMHHQRSQIPLSNKRHSMQVPYPTMPLQSQMAHQTSIRQYPSQLHLPSMPQQSQMTPKTSDSIRQQSPLQSLRQVESAQNAYTHASAIPPPQQVLNVLQQNINHQQQPLHQKSNQWQYSSQNNIQYPQTFPNSSGYFQTIPSQNPSQYQASSSNYYPQHENVTMQQQQMNQQQSLLQKTQSYSNIPFSHHGYNFSPYHQPQNSYPPSEVNFVNPPPEGVHFPVTQIASSASTTDTIQPLQQPTSYNTCLSSYGPEEVSVVNPQMALSTASLHPSPIQQTISYTVDSSGYDSTLTSPDLNPVYQTYNICNQ